MSRKLKFLVTLKFTDRGVLDHEVVESALREAIDNEFDNPDTHGIPRLLNLDVTPGTVGTPRLPLSVCDDCGAEVLDGMNCPDGAFVCHECFNNGAH